MNITDAKGFVIETPILPDPSTVEILELDSVFQYALANLPQVKSKEYGVEAMERYVALQKGQRSPRLFARGLIYSNYSDQLINPLDPDPGNPTMDYPTRDQITDNRYMQASMGMIIPIFNRWQVQTDIKKAKIDLRDAEYQYDDAVLVMQKTLQQYYTEALAATDNYNSALESVANSDEASRFADERFRVGTGTALEMQEAIADINEGYVKDIVSEPVNIGVSVFTGEVVVGNIGFDMKMDYTVIGDAVNNVFKLQELTKFKNNSIVIAENTSRAAQTPLDLNELDSNVADIKVYELLGRK